MDQVPHDLERTTRQRVARAAKSLLAALRERTEVIGAPPLLLEQDIDTIVLSAGGALGLDRPDPDFEPAGYRDWMIGWAPQADAAAALAQSAREQVVEGYYDEDLHLALGAEGLGKLLASERRRVEGQASPGDLGPDLDIP